MDSSRHAGTRRSYDAVAAEYAASFAGELDGKPLDRALLASLIEQAVPGAPVADLGCGPGHVTSWLARHGTTAVGIDLSAAMTELGRQLYPEATFRQGDLLDLPAADGEFGAVIAFYSLIHLEPAELTPAVREICRVLAPGGLALISFHAGSDVVHRDEWLGHPVDVDFRFLEMADVTAALEAAGLAVQMRLERISYPAEVATTRGYVLASSPADG
ncbi:MAG TPA: methyltransferase domain-containing protein [Streptosporangiaceae bacterium]|jgi:SAM-dependent methyltransferase